MKMKEHAGLIWGLIGAAIAVLGTIKTLLSISTGNDFSLQKAGFYVGATAVIIYFGAFMAIIVAAILLMIAKLMVGEEKSEGDSVVYPVLWVAGAVGLWFAGAIVFSDWLRYEDTDAFGQGAFALLGLAALAGTIYMWRQKTKTAQTEQ